MLFLAVHVSSCGMNLKVTSVSLGGWRQNGKIGLQIGAMQVQIQCSQAGASQLLAWGL